MCNQPRKVVHPDLCGKFLISLVSITQTKSAAVTKCAVSYRFIVTHVSKNTLHYIKRLLFANVIHIRNRRWVWIWWRRSPSKNSHSTEWLASVVFKFYRNYRTASYVYYYAGIPIESAVYCLHKPFIFLYNWQTNTREKNLTGCYKNKSWKILKYLSQALGKTT